MGCYAELCGIVQGSRAVAPPEDWWSLDEQSHFDAFFWGGFSDWEYGDTSENPPQKNASKWRIFGLGVWIHVRCSQYQESHGASRERASKSRKLFRKWGIFGDVLL